MIQFENNLISVLGAMDNAINIALEECAGELEAQTKRNTRVDTGRTKNSWRHVVDKEKHEAIIGSDYQNAIWEEFGTGEYALNNNGRKGGWCYRDSKGELHFTRGKTASRAFYRAYVSLKSKVESRLQNALKDMK